MPSTPQWNPTQYHGHINERQALIIGIAATVFAMAFSVGVVVWVGYGALCFFGFL